MPRIGLVLELSEAASSSIDAISWQGRGPHENYPDRKRSAQLGSWCLPIADAHPYIFLATTVCVAIASASSSTSLW